MNPRYPTTYPERATLYLHCMLEMRERLGVVNALLDWKIPALFVREMAYLQLRHICEVLAIACLSAQGDFHTQRAFRKEYRPPIIFDALRAIYPQYFPKPAQRTWMEGKHHLQGLADTGAYTEKDIIALWSIAGDKLHRLSVAKYLKTSFGSENPDASDIRTHVNGLANLLAGHVIPLENCTPKKTLFHVEIESTPGPIHAHFLHFDPLANTVEIESFAAEIARHGEPPRA